MKTFSALVCFCLMCNIVQGDVVVNVDPVAKAIELTGISNEGTAVEEIPGFPFPLYKIAWSATLALPATGPADSIAIHGPSGSDYLSLSNGVGFTPSLQGTVEITNNELEIIVRADSPSPTTVTFQQQPGAAALSYANWSASQIAALEASDGVVLTNTFGSGFGGGVIRVASGPGASVPEPGTFALVGGMVGLVLSSRRRLARSHVQA